jgi:hypothetical protein
MPAYIHATSYRRHTRKDEVSLELHGSNDVANLYPEKANPHPGFHVKDKLENRLRDLVCDGTMTLRIVKRQIAANWQAPCKKVYGTAP